ncbi:unnamed protein product [Amoebophrya sp. A120]|nr:unnamed protein product [Amoebophrya sp. A120]|eukprot:GSA120T00014174001.1
MFVQTPPTPSSPSRGPKVSRHVNSNRGAGSYAAGSSSCSTSTAGTGKSSSTVGRGPHNSWQAVLGSKVTRSSATRNCGPSGSEILLASRNKIISSSSTSASKTSKAEQQLQKFFSGNYLDTSRSPTTASGREMLNRHETVVEEQVWKTKRKRKRKRLRSSSTTGEHRKQVLSSRIEETEEADEVACSGAAGPGTRETIPQSCPEIVSTIKPSGSSSSPVDATVDNLFTAPTFTQHREDAERNLSPEHVEQDGVEGLLVREDEKFVPAASGSCSKKRCGFPSATGRATSSTSSASTTSSPSSSTSTSLRHGSRTKYPKTENKRTTSSRTCKGLLAHQGVITASKNKAASPGRGSSNTTAPESDTSTGKIQRNEPGSCADEDSQSATQGVSGKDNKPLRCLKRIRHRRTKQMWWLFLLTQPFRTGTLANESPTIANLRGGTGTASSSSSGASRVSSGGTGSETASSAASASLDGAEDGIEPGTEDENQSKYSASNFENIHPLVPKQHRNRYSKRQGGRTSATTGGELVDDFGNTGEFPPGAGDQLQPQGFSRKFDWLRRRLVVVPSGGIYWTGNAGIARDSMSLYTYPTSARFAELDTTASVTAGDFTTTKHVRESAEEYKALQLRFSKASAHTWLSGLQNSLRTRFVGNTVTKTTAEGSNHCQDNQATVPGCSVISNAWCQNGGKALPATNAFSTGGADNEQNGWLQYGTPTSDSTALKFLMGGFFRICVSGDGSFTTGNVDVWPVEAEIYGVYDHNYAAGTVDYFGTTKKYYCYLLRNQHNNPTNTYTYQSTHCVVAFDGANQGWVGIGETQYKGSWGPSFDTATPTAAQLCGQSTYATQICMNGGAGGDCNTPVESGAANRLKLAVQQRGTGRFHLPSTKNTLTGGATDGSGFVPFSTAACWCPAASCLASSPLQYSQMLGTVHFYTAKTCRSDDKTCGTDYTGTIPQKHFKIRINCPEGACANAKNNRFKIIARSPTAAYDYPKFDSRNICRTKMHGRNFAGREIMATTPLPVGVVLPTGNTGICSGVIECNMNGTVEGAPHTMKEFPPYTQTDPLSTIAYTTGFKFDAAEHDYERVNFHNSVGLDICYCDGLCTQDAGANWFKVGQIRFTGVRLLSSVSPTASNANLLSLQYVLEPGQIVFRRDAADNEVMGLAENGVVKIIEQTGAHGSDAQCQTNNNEHLANLVEPVGGLSAASAYTNYRGKGVNSDRLAFNAGNSANKITIKKAGVIGICYCQFADANSNGCMHKDYWILAARMTIKGPTAGHNWSFSTQVVFKLEYFGFGLSSDNKLRIISGDGKCSDNNRNPDKGSYPFTYLQVDAPEFATNVGSITDTVNGDLKTLITTSSTFNCDDKFENCKRNDIRSVTAISDTETEVEFELDPEFAQDGSDVITLGDNIICHPNSYQCSNEKLMELKGVFTYSDAGANNAAATDSYMVGHKIKPTTDPLKWRIQYGWKADCYSTGNPPPPNACAAGENGRPLFQVQFASITAGSSPVYGQWARRNRAMTKWEIKGVRDRTNLRVCFHYGGTDPNRFVEEVGFLTLVGANPMQDVRLSLTSTLLDAKAPVVISFKTASATTGARYSQVVGETQLKFVLQDTSTFEIYYSDDIASSIEANASEDDYEEARQYICGRLFREMWSDDLDYGFPLPKGCYYKKYGFTREIFVVFEAKNGLRPGYNYQVVMHGSVHGAATAGGKYLEVFTMDDRGINPYLAIERGEAALSKTPERISTSVTSPRWLNPGGVRILEDYPGQSKDNVVTLVSGDALRMELAGDPTYQIKQGAIIRLYLQPLTTWNIGSTCLATAIPYDAVAHQGGPAQNCQGVPTVLNSYNNVVKITMPAIMTTIQGSVKMQLRVQHLTMPKNGFFSTRLGAQVTDELDTRPSYILSGNNNYLYKEPDAGTTIAKIVTSFGDGNSRPFKAQTSNILYVRLQFAATLFAANLNQDAGFDVRLPPGYNCTIPDQMGILATAYNPWAAESTLNLYAHTAPQGRGAPTTSEYVAGVTSHGWSVFASDPRLCRFRLRQYGLIPSGSAIIVKFTVNNPATALAQDNKLNEWTVSQMSKGYFSLPMTTSPVIFKATIEANYSSNVAVLGYLRDTILHPSDFMGAQLSNRVVRPQLFVFLKTESPVGLEGMIVLQAPMDNVVNEMQSIRFQYDYPNCHASDLPMEYYAFRPGELTHRLPNGVKQCIYERTPRNRAKVQVSGIIDANKKFGFALRSINPYVFDVTQLVNWKMFTQDSQSRDVDGSFDGVFDSGQGTIALTEGIGTTNYTDLSGRSFGLYNYDLNTPQEIRCDLSINDMRPFALSNVYSDLTFFVRNLPMTLTNVKLRIIAPFGYEWKPGTKWAYRNSGPSATLYSTSASADFPHTNAPTVGPLHVLNFANPTTYDFSTANKHYGFKVPVQVPNYAPHGSMANFTVEFGYDGTTLATRPFGGVIPAPKIRALTSASVGYSTNVANRENRLSFTIGTVTQLPQNGGLVLISPTGYLYEKANCGLENLRPLPEGTVDLPAGTTCSVWSPPRELLEEDDSVDGAVPTRLLTTATRPELRITSAQGVLPPATYGFVLIAKNPTLAVSQAASVSSSCGYTMCWDFSTASDTTVATSLASAASSQDRPIAATSFPVNERMMEARLLLLDQPSDEPVRLATGRDDRPLRPNSLIFSFKLNKDAKPQTNPVVSTYDMSIRAPEGFLFYEDCLSVLEVRPTTVFGGQPMPADYTVWSTDIEITYCRGSKNTAVFTVQPKDKVYLEAARLYAFRIGIKSNPEFTPAENNYALEFNGESSVNELMPGFVLWTFTETNVETRSTARSPANEIRHIPVKFDLKPRNTISPDLPTPNSGGVLKLIAPQDFKFSQTNGICNRISIYAGPHVITVDKEDVQLAEEFWSANDIRCRVQAAVPATDDGQIGPDRVLLLYLNSDKAFMAHRKYRLQLDVQNPLLALEEFLYKFFVVSYSYEDMRAGSELDEMRIPAYEVNHVMKRFFLRNENAQFQPIRNGMTAIPNLFVHFESPVRMDPGHQVVYIAPTTFQLTKQLIGSTAVHNTECNEFKFDPVDALYLGPQSTVFCYKNLIVMDVVSFTVPKDTAVKFRINTVNPPATPELFDNFWRVYHYKKTVYDSTAAKTSATVAESLLQLDPLLLTKDTAGSPQLMASDIWESWQILPQLMGVQIRLGLLPNANRAAGSRSDIEFRFVSVSVANEVRLTADSPAGFDFTLAKLVTGQEIKTVDGATISIRANINPAVISTTVIHLQEVKLGAIGSPTIFSITTLLNGVTKDEKLGFQYGFSQPGKISSFRTPRLYSGFSMHPVQYPIKEKLPMRIDSPAYADFFIMLSTDAPAGSYFTVSGPPYQIMNQNFAIHEYDAEHLMIDSMFKKVGTAVSFSVISYGGGQIDVQLQETLKKETHYVITVFMQTPTMPGETWRIETRSWKSTLAPECQPQQLDPSIAVLTEIQCLPSNTNDGDQGGFHLVGKIAVTASAPGGSPPLAKLTTRVRINPAAATPNRLRIVAPSNFNFTEGNSLLTSSLDVLECRQGPPMASRNTALCTCRPDGLQSEVSIDLLMVPPRKTPVPTAWFVIGEDSVSNAIVAWGEDPIGYPIQQMAETTVLYTAVPGVESEITIGFKSSITLEGGGTILVLVPEAFEVNCEDGNLKPISLIGDVKCEQGGNNQVRLKLSSTLPAAQYAFSMRTMVPQTTPVNNRFSVLLYDLQKEVRDAAMDREGLKMLSGIDIRFSDLSWNRADANKKSDMTVAFTVYESTTSFGDRSLRDLGEVLINFPEGFFHTIVSFSEVKTALNGQPGGMPLVMDEDDVPRWLDSTQQDRLRISLMTGPDVDPSGLQQQGTYSFSFQAVVPAQIPPYNVWTVSLCEGSGGCISAFDSSVKLAFPVPGFVHGQLAANAGDAPAASGASSGNGDDAEASAAFAAKQIPWMLLLAAVGSSVFAVVA